MSNPRIRTLAELKQAARRESPLRVVVAAAGDAVSLETVIAAGEHGLARATLVGPAQLIEGRLVELGADPADFVIVDAPDEKRAAERAAAMVAAGEGDLLLKGSISTAGLLHAVLHSGLKTGRLLCDVMVFEDTREAEPRLVLCSDGGVTVAPTLKQRLEIIKNSVSVAHRLGIELPKVALLSGVEKVTPDMPSTIDAVALAKMASYGDVISGCVVDGPFALDNAISMEAAQIKGIKSPVAGQADILIVPTLENGNIFGKTLMYFANKTLAHVIVGAGAPVLICSRADRKEAKLASIALGVLCCGRDRP